MDKLSINICHEDNHLLAVNKMAGILIHGDKTGDITLLDHAKNYIKRQYNKPGMVFLQPVHRIDRPVSGLVLFARTSKATERLNKIIAKRDVNKKYIALVEKRPSNIEAKLTNYLRRDTTKNKAIVVKKKSGDAKLAHLTYRWLGENKGMYILEIDLETGRHHQIRAQLAAAGMPIVGDLKYGAKQKTDGRSIALHSYKMEFLHPVKKEPTIIIASLPKAILWKGVTGFLS